MTQAAKINLLINLPCQELKNMPLAYRFRGMTFVQRDSEFPLGCDLCLALTFLIHCDIAF